MSTLFFGLQVAVEAPPHDPWRRRLTELVRQHTRDESNHDMRGFHGKLANLLLEAADRVTLGFWDLREDGKAEYDEWTSGIEDDSAETWLPDPSGERMHHVLVSAMFMLRANGPAARLIGDRCDLPEHDWMRRATFRRLFEALTQLDVSSVNGSACYVTPGGDRLGFSLRELRGSGYEYLLPIG